MNQTHGFTYGSFVWWIGEVLNRKDDPLKIGRVKVKIFGYYDQIDEDDIPWAMVVQSPDSAASKEIGHSPTGFIEGTMVVGFFADGANAQTPIVIGSLQGVPGGKPDSHKLARGEELSQTIIQKKKASAVNSNAPGNPWVEPPTPSNPEYPYNQMRMTESGHIEEFDDTGGGSIYGLWHPSGTWEENRTNGDRADHVKKDRYSITMGDDYVHIQGDCRVNIFGNARVVVMGDSYYRVQGNMRQIIRGNYDVDIGGTYTVNSNGSTVHESVAPMKLRSSRIDLNDTGPSSAKLD